jgi:hypothetical protein
MTKALYAKATVILVGGRVSAQIITATKFVRKTKN